MTKLTIEEHATTKKFGDLPVATVFRDKDSTYIKTEPHADDEGESWNVVGLGTGYLYQFWNHQEVTPVSEVIIKV